MRIDYDRPDVMDARVTIKCNVRELLLLWASLGITSYQDNSEFVMKKLNIELQNEDEASEWATELFCDMTSVVKSIF